MGPLRDWFRRCRRWSRAERIKERILRCVQVQPATTSFTTTAPNGKSVSGRPRFQILFLARPYLSAFFLVRCLSYRFAIFSVPIFSVSDVKKLVVRHGRCMWRYADGTLAFWLRDTYVRLLEWLELPPSLLQSDSC